jgi:hypothetical protein
MSLPRLAGDCGKPGRLNHLNRLPQVAELPVRDLVLVDPPGRARLPLAASSADPPPVRAIGRPQR